LLKDDAIIQCEKVKNDAIHLFMKDGNAEKIARTVYAVSKRMNMGTKNT
jgi:hypothetical protein